MTTYLLFMFALPALEMFDRLYDRHATRLRAYEAAHGWLWFDFGYLEDSDCRDSWRRFFHLRLPVYQWTSFNYDQRWGWGQLTIWWAEGRGFHADYWPVREDF